MSDPDTQVPLPDLNAADAATVGDIAYREDENAARVAADLEAVFDVNSTAGSAKPSIFSSTTAWSPAARWFWSKTSLASR
jgi:hypothetical protein